MTNKAEMWLMSHRDYFEAEKMLFLQEQISKIPEDRANMLCTIPLKNPTKIIFMSLFFGSFGVDRFMLGDAGLGVLKILTLGGVGIWAIIDIFSCYKRAKEKNFGAIMQIIGQYVHR